MFLQKKGLLFAIIMCVALLSFGCGSIPDNQIDKEGFNNETTKNEVSYEETTDVSEADSENGSEQETELASSEDANYEVVEVTDFNDDGYAWVVLAKGDERRYALLNDLMEICCILSLEYNEISTLYPFQLDFSGNGSTLVEMNNGEKHIINANGEITYTLDTTEYDDICFNRKGCYTVSKTTSGYDDYGIDYGIVDAYGQPILSLMRINQLKEVGAGIFSFAQNTGYRYDYVFFNAENGRYFQIEDLSPNYLMLNERDIFYDGVAVVELGTGRMLDPIALTDADTGETRELSIQKEYAFYDYGPVCDGGFIYYSYSYEGNRGDVVSSFMFYDIESGEGYPIFDDPERIKYGYGGVDSDSLQFIDGYVALELMGADGDTYYSIVNKNGEVVFGPQKDISSIQNKGEGYFYILSENGSEILSMNGKAPLSTDLKISSFNRGYAVVNYGSHYIDADGNEVEIDLTRIKE